MGEGRPRPRRAGIETASSRPSRDLQDLWRRIVFSVLVSNTDGHLRNHGFVHAGGTSWNLAPAFDLDPDPSPGPRFLSTAIDTGDDSADIDLALSVAEYFRLSDQRARRVLSEVADAVDSWRDIASRSLPRSAVDRIAPAFGAVGAHRR